MKKVMALIMAIMMTGSLTACGSLAQQAAEETTANASVQEQVYQVGICQLVQHEALDAATLGFTEALKEVLGDQVVIEEQNASNDQATCATIINQFVASDVDLIMANATPALQAAIAATDTIPIVATSITDYATALEISDWTGTTGMNVTGTADLAPLEEQAAMILELVPEAKKVAILYCSAEPNSKYQSDIVTGELQKLGIEVEEFTFADSNDVMLVTEAAVAAADVIYVPTDNTVASNTEMINSVAEDAGVPIIAGEEGICKGCGIATLSIDYYSIGYRAGEMAADILANGADPATMEIDFAEELTKKAMASRCEALGIAVPEGYELIEE
ncbi:MAG: ABC transporter substrate-binding protein [Lachnospiraceae bacterium]|nr:ABC transporter substrate-binding protein [Lachnospiraceae bacterium]